MLKFNIGKGHQVTNWLQAFAMAVVRMAHGTLWKMPWGIYVL